MICILSSMDNGMKIEDILLHESTSIRDAATRLEKVRCKICYIEKGGKLVASISDGDIRRAVMKGAAITDPVSSIANYDFKFFYVYEQNKVIEAFKTSELFSIPVTNYNRQIVAVYFKNGKVVKKEQNMDAPVVMVAGGKGTRLYPYTKILPKALIPIGEVPIAEIIFSRFFDCGCKKFFMIINHKKEMIQAYFKGKEYPYHISYAEESSPLGTGGGLMLVKEKITKDFFFINCDVIIDADYSEIYSFHRKQGNYITIVGAKYTNTIPYGVIHYDENGYQGMEEKPTFECTMNTGMYVVSPDIFHELKKDENISFPEIIDRCYNKGKKIGVYTIEESAYMDMGQLEELEKMRMKLNVNTN